MQNNLNALQQFFNTNATTSYQFRRNSLLKLKATLLKYEQEIYAALYTDLKKSKEDAYVTELGLVLSEISHTLKHLKKWMAPKRVGTNLLNLPGSSKIYKQPLGVVLIIAPWNYPLQLALMPLVGAIAAGNCVVLKPSELAPQTASITQIILDEAFASQHVITLQGDGATVVGQAISNFTFAHIFYTGSTQVGKIIYKQAAETLTPVTLELGGKSPCIVTETANIKVAAKRITMAKFSNCGQMCITPDYVLVHHSVKNALITEIINCITQFYTANPQVSNSYGKIINQKRFNEICAYLTQGTIAHGGKTASDKLYIEPTLLTNVALNSPIMQQEIFGPILPILTYQTQQEAVDIIAQNPDPLALYVYTNTEADKKCFIENISFGGGCINNSVFHITNTNLPFGGIRNSGLGSYHGVSTFNLFTHHKSVLSSATWFNPAIKFPPFDGRLNIFKKIMR